MDKAVKMQIECNMERRRLERSEGCLAPAFGVTAFWVAVFLLGYWVA